MSYERLTDKNDLYWALQETKLSAEVGIYLTDCLNRLAELETKIEQGTLIELPCKVGDTVYWLVANKYIIECVVSLINISVGKKHILQYGQNKNVRVWKTIFHRTI